ncbi:phosphoethanolamine transferase [Aliiglaciecola lipolytica]|uniref:Phosphoethanolamine transferase n=1 Tax=Aliiglaciecola lipolytica E3 TaxID=1127673 RepID=K6X8E0_9ALTE|nr:phosphoethanolamine--lipid A transferase [Aliiglaciecola lipolytica]GAC16879.1 phosphoethanolamine transferase [Aliiglaciecola lipolytica E3]
MSASLQKQNIVSNFRQISSNKLILAVSCYLVLILNYPFLAKTFSAIVNSADYNVLFLISVPVLFICVFNIIQSMIAIGGFLKPVLIAMVVISSIIAYATLNYGTVFDFAMVQNVVESDSAEAFSYVNLTAIVFILMFGVVPALFIALAKIKKQSILTACINRSKVIGLCIIIVGLIGFSYFANYASVGRNNRDLVHYITPFKLFDASYKYATRHFFSPPREFLELDSTPFLKSSNGNPRVTVVLLGETARAQNFSLNGYEKDTNRFTKDLEIVSFLNISSCGTATAVSVPCMFSRLSKSEYDKQIANSQQNALDVAHLAGVDVLWIDNNNGSCKGVCNRISHIEISPDSQSKYCDGEYCLDEILLTELDKKLKNITHKDTLIVMHMMGSHGPTYYRRYPTNKRIFEPDCPRSDIQNCTNEELVNSYDNTISYTDFVVSQVISRLLQLDESTGSQSTMLYVSDHGESLGEKGVYLHGLPYAFAPAEQTHVPLLFWQDPENSSFSLDCLQNQAQLIASHDNFFDTLLGVLSVQSKLYQKHNDLIAKCKGDSRIAFKQGYGIQTNEETK